jgi:hypothetical protein
MLLDERGYDVWFEGDLPRAYAQMSTRWPEPVYHKYHTRRHPLFIPFTLPLVKACRALLGVEPLTAVQIVLAALAAVWIGTLWGLLRLLGCRRLDAMLFSALGAVSAAAVFWLTVPETWALGSLSILAPLLLVAVTRHRQVSEGWYVLASAGSLAVTVTNWMTGLIAAFRHLPWKRALRVSGLALSLVLGLWSLQKLALPQVQFFLTVRPGSEAKYVFHTRSGGPLQIGTAFIFHPMVMPAITETSAGRRPWKRMTVQPSAPGSASGWGRIGVWLWAALLGLGVWAALRSEVNRRLLGTVGIVLAGQLALHLIYGGEEIFLYSLHWAPLLVVVAACATLTPARRLALALAGALIVCAGVNNAQQFASAVGYTQRYAQGLLVHRSAP